MAKQSDLDLAALGKDVWNDWAKKNEGVAVDFSGHVFQPDSANFEGFTFPGDANFTNCRFLGKAQFHEATFAGNADFSHATFKAYAGLDRIKFRKDASFEHSVFEQWAYVPHSRFQYANFRSATFNGTFELTSSTCSGETDFTNATFANPIFKGVQFKHPLTTFATATFNKVPDFRNSSFETPPILYGIVVGHPKSEEEDADKYRRLKLLASDAKDHQSELRFFADELRAKRGHETKGGAAIRLNKAYECVSDFGQSIALPAWWLLGLIVVSWIVRVLACLPSSFDAIWPHFLMSLADTALLVGSEKWELRINALPLARCSRHFDLLEHVGALFQSGAGIVLLFLIGLGLRNRFRIGSGN